MIWELDTPTIVMVTNLMEEEKVGGVLYLELYGTVCVCVCAGEMSPVLAIVRYHHLWQHPSDPEGGGELGRVCHQNLQRLSRKSTLFLVSCKPVLAPTIHRENDSHFTVRLFCERYLVDAFP